MLSAGKILWKALMTMLTLLMILFALRNFMAFLLTGSFAVWLLCFFNPARKSMIIVSVIAVAIVAFFLSGKISPATDLPQYVIQKQAEFKQLSGASNIDVPPLGNNVVSFIQFLPTAFDIALFRPHISEIKNISYIPAVAEIILFWGLILLSMFVRNKTKIAQTNLQSSFLVWCIFFSFSFLLLAGYTITFSGAIVRYKACVLPFLFVPVVQKLSLLLRNRKNSLTGNYPAE
jgi:hypothetical protein